jgi:hypothetical protein
MGCSYPVPVRIQEPSSQALIVVHTVRGRRKLELLGGLSQEWQRHTAVIWSGRQVNLGAVVGGGHRGPGTLDSSLLLS